MARAMIPSQQKLAEKLTILNDRGVGMLTRIYNIKKMLGSAESKPAFFSDKLLDPIFKSIVKKFPLVDTKSPNVVNTIHPKMEDIHKALSLYYYTFVDIMDYKDHVTNLLTTISSCQVYFDLTVNYDLTKLYLDLIVNYVSVMTMMSRVDDRKAVLGLFALVYELQHTKGEESFPRLGQVIIDYENPIKKISEEFIPHSKCLMQALVSLQQVYPRRTLVAEQWRSAQMLSLLSDATKIMNVAQIDTMPCEYLSLDIMDRWIIFGYLLCHQHQGLAEIQDMWRQALHNGYVTCLCRDEVIATHPFVIGFYECFKGQNKKVAEVKEYYQEALQKAPLVHREKRKFLRTALKELGLVFTDQPGLLGPKALYIFMALSFARDEIHWLLRHHENPPPKKQASKASQEEFVDRQIPELMFHIEELRALVEKYNQVLQRYYVQYLSGFDAAVLDQHIQSLSACPDDENVILSSVYSCIVGLSVKRVEENELFDFRGMRLDWVRLQALTSVAKPGIDLRELKDLARHMNTIVFHTKMVDSLDVMLVETSDLSIYCFHTSAFEQQFRQCLEFPAQHRYCVSFPLICVHFMQATHDLCPEEKFSIGTTSVQYAYWFLEEMAEEVNQVITAICEEHCLLADKLLPMNCAEQIASVALQRNKDKKGKAIVEPEKPGAESYRKHREDFTKRDKLHMALTELCYAINYCNVITVWEHGFVPREFFTQKLETRFNKALVGMVNYNAQTQEIAKPSELLNSVRAMMSMLQSIENYVHVDISRVFNNVLPQQTQPLDSFSGEKTITSCYTDWYLEVLLRRVSAGHIVYSPNHKAFISLSSEGQLPFSAEDYADLTELRALSELIGPYGIKYLSERLMWHISSQVEELKKLVLQNKDTLQQIRVNFDKSEQMKELQKKLIGADNVLQRMTIVGVLLSFRALAQEALLDVLEDHVPFLLSSIKDFQQHLPSGQDSMIVNEMASAAGLACDIDPALCAALRAQKSEIAAENGYEATCLLMVFVAVSLPRLARSDNCFYKAAWEGHVNNVHCLAKAVNSLAGALFTIHGKEDVEDRLKEFLALASSSLLKLGQETEKEAIKNRESVYILLDEIVQQSPFLSMDLLEACFPYALLRTAYHHVYRYKDY